MKHGEIYLVDLPSLDPPGHEIQGSRPALILSNDVFNNKTAWKTLIVVPISSSPTQAQRDYAVVIPKGAGGLDKDSVVLCHQITALDRSRIRQFLGKLDAKMLRAVEDEVRLILYF